MALTKRTHWLGVLLLFAASMLLLVTTISSPIINQSGLLRVTLANYTAREHSAMTFGTFGYCVLGVPPVETQQSWCTGRHIGYDISDIIRRATATYYETTSGGTANSLTHVMVLHPIACGLAFIAFLTTIGGRTIMASLSGILVTLLAWILALASVAVDFTAFGIVKREINTQASGVFPVAEFASAMWCLVAGFVLLTIGIIVMALSFFGAIKDRRAERRRGTKCSRATQSKRRNGLGYSDLHSHFLLGCRTRCRSKDFPVVLMGCFMKL